VLAGALGALLVCDEEDEDPDDEGDGELICDGAEGAPPWYCDPPPLLGFEFPTRGVYTFPPGLVGPGFGRMTGV